MLTGIIAMPDPSGGKECFLYLLQYVPNLISGEFLNVGVVLYCPDENYLGCMVTRNLHRIARFHLQADLEFFRELPSYFRELVTQHADDPRETLRSVGSYSNAIQLTSPRACFLREPQREITKLFVQHIGAEFN